MTSKPERASLANESGSALEETKRRIDEALSTLTLTEIEQLVEEIESMLGKD